MKEKELISALIKLSKVDNYFDEYEFTYILKVGRYLNLDDTLVEKMIKEPIDDTFVIPQSEQDRMTLLYFLLFLMKVDNIINEHEVELVHHYGFKLGFSKVMIDDFIDLMKGHLGKEMPKNAMLEIVKKYSN